MRQLRYCVAHPLTGRYGASVIYGRVVRRFATSVSVFVGKFLPDVAETWFGEEKRVSGQIASKGGHRCLAKFFWVSLVVPVFDLSASRVQWFTAVEFSL
ncbi:TPA: hypothetical protein I7245_21635 [Vibrio vulnificus]|uniref:hypothetical protein n=1 Tax=Vibrio vulnificus TaxID=672 RepID=UPI001A352472|nr:hypothetical protein [Vibrio vulnificus]WHE21904.1 hypothetical protein PVE41_01710 [Vibrio vulnificus]HAS6208559.1 hypothetical protein [Vibrio vulnificus]HAS6331928.1 hypothetical protein [Vibrio vulnificus]HAS6336594.1 hypothetical protein [Vibrio vulnificus]HAT8497834.1 hypothetical protein [Vibrio vulnificus]